MKIITAYPPNFRDIVRVFPQARARGVIFAYGDTIFNPSGGKLSPALIAHEEVHGQRQSMNPPVWWMQYLDDRDFRLAEEVVAHRAEYRENPSREALQRIAHRLSGPLYGKMISYDAAEQAIAA